MNRDRKNRKKKSRKYHSRSSDKRTEKENVMIYMAMMNTSKERNITNKISKYFPVNNLNHISDRTLDLLFI